MSYLLRILLFLSLTSTATWAYEFKYFTVNKNYKRNSNNLILQELSQYLSSRYERLGHEQTRELIENHDLGGGVYNYSGFTWYKPMLNYDVKVDRSVAPDLMSDKWIVQDKFMIFIEAATLLEYFKDQGIISITDTNLEAFAGLTFSRTYSYFHFADTYLDGLTSDYSKLFLSFRAFHTSFLDQIATDEIIKKKDLFTFNAGGRINAPLPYGFDLQAGLLLSKALANQVTIQKTNEELKLSLEKEKSKSAQVSLDLQYDFFNLLKISLLSYELNYTLDRSQKTYLNFENQDLKLIESDRTANREMNKHLKGNQTVNFWKRNITTLEDRLKENFSSKYSFLLYGSLKKKATEQIIVIKNGIKKVFFRHYSYTKKYLQGLMSRIFSTVVQRIFDFDWAIKDRAYTQNNVIIEFEKEENFPEHTVSEPEKFSVSVSKSVYVEKTHKWYHRRFKIRILKSLKGWSLDTEEIRKRISQKSLIGPITLATNFEIHQPGFKYLKSRKIESVSLVHKNICSQKYRKNRLKRCVKRLDKYFKRYKLETEISLMNIKKYLEQILKTSTSLDSLYDLFNREHVFVHGQVQARQRSNNQFFTHFFKSGQFNGVGVIEAFKQSNQLIPND